MGINWRTINDWMSWVSLGRIRNSFVSKTLTVLSVASFALVSVAPQIEALGANMDAMRAVYLGGVIFLAGYILYAVLAPAEFRQSGEIYEIVQRMAILADWTFYKSRQGLASNLLMEERQNGLLRAPEGAFIFLNRHVEAAKKITAEDDWEASARSLYHADLNLRQYSRPVARGAVALLLAGGCLGIAYPSMKNGVLALWGML